jgi:hypothetical protein
MKTTIKILIYASLLVVPSLGFAQYSTWNSGMDVNGIYLGSIYSKTQVTAKWGTPTKYESQTSENGLIEFYDYGNNSFEFSDNGLFHSFHIRTPNFVFWASKSGGFKVGDPVSRLKSIGVISNSTSLSTSTGKNVVEIPGDDRFRVGYSNGIITYISYTSSL